VSPHDGALLAHGVGGPEDLPVPADYALIGAACALLVSFVVLAFAWRTPRFRGDASGRPLPHWLAAVVESRALRGTVVTISLAFTTWVLMAAVLGKNTFVNPVFGSVYVLLWVGLVPAALLFGPVYRLCNPLRWVHRGICKLAGTDPAVGLRPYPATLGMWPAAGFLFAFVWLELVGESQDLTTVRLWFGLVGVLLLAGAAVFGDEWFARADPFEVYSSLVARLSPWGRRNDGVLVVRNPLVNLDGLRPTAGLVAVVAVLLGSTAFDSFSGSSRWLRFSQQYVDHARLLDTATLVVFCLVVAASFVLASVATGGLGHIGRKNMPRLLAHSLVPIIVGYVVAHYFSYFVAGGIATLQQLGDPLSRGWDLSSWLADVNKYAIYGYPTLLAVTKVVAVVSGHVLGVVSAHDRSVQLLPKRHALVGQIPLLLLMVGYTVTGLWLLFSS
jgi:hypothetical protein